MLTEAEAPTIVHAFVKQAERPDGTLRLFSKHLLFCPPTNGRFLDRSGAELAAEAYEWAALLVQLGVEPGDRVIHLSENRYEWVIGDLAIQFARGIHVPVHAPLTGLQIAWQAQDSGAKVVILSDPAQAAKLVGHDASLAGVQHFVSYDRCQQPLAGKPVQWLQDLRESPTAIDPRKLRDSALANTTPDDIATIIYTSGTTGEPKGVMLTQRNLATNALATMRRFYDDSPPRDPSLGPVRRLNFLPLSHIFARTCDLYLWIMEGSELAIAESRDTVLADAAAVQPTFMNGVPYFYDKVYRGLKEKGVENVPGILQKVLGGRIELCCGGGAALPEHLYDYFHGQGVPLLQGYGLTESSPVISMSTLRHHRRGASGQAISGIEVKIADDGEILTRGPHVMVGYYQRPDATAEVLKDGWLYTGDLGRLDDDGYLFITGRKKELIVTLGGKNIAPVYLEGLLTQDPLIAQALVIGDGRSYLTALIVPNPEPLKAEILSRGIPVASPAEALVHPQVLSLYQDRITRCLADLAPYEQVKKFTLLPRGFSLELGEMTAKLSLRRKIVEEHFAAEIEAMYRRE
ncbi:MAG TPA: long-chain fatty acid--CoA ligase [Pirellulaceae bacterium]|nr:long-chain fatty acid--CoA ligase [Pirellulaceae bacterium]